MSPSLPKFIAEPVEVSFGDRRGFEKRPECPVAFTWRGATHEIESLLSEWQDYTRRDRMAHNMRPAHAAAAERRGSWGVGRRYFRVRTVSGRVFDLYYDRAPGRAGDRAGGWFLFRELPPGEHGGPSGGGPCARGGSATRIAVMGAGGLGGLLGGLLAEAGGDVALIARGAHLEAVRARGLTLERDGAPPRGVSVRATDRPDEVGVVDLLLFCVKTYDLDEAAEAARPLAGDATIVLPFQNGVEAPARLARTFGSERVAAGVSYVLGKLDRPGVVSYGAIMGRLLVGQMGRPPSDRLRDVASLFLAAGLRANVVDDARAALWEKLVLVCATGGVMALERRPIGEVLADTDASRMLRSVMEEAAEVGRAGGVAVPSGTVEHHLRFIRTGMAPHAMSSQLIDLLAGRRLELESLNGYVARRGRELGVATPANTMIYEALLPYVEGKVS